MKALLKPFRWMYIEKWKALFLTIATLPVMTLIIVQSEWFWRRSLRVQIALLLLGWFLSILITGLMKEMIFKVTTVILKRNDFGICILLSFLSVFFVSRTPFFILASYAVKVSYYRYLLILAEIGFFILLLPIWYLVVSFSYRLWAWLTNIVMFLSARKSIIKPSVWFLGILPAILFQTQLDSGLLMETVPLDNQSFIQCPGYEPFAYCISIGENWMSGSRQYQSQTKVLENGVRLPYPNSLHKDIAQKGQGSYSIWGTTLYMSAADNSDPGNNQHVYEMMRPRFFPKWFLWTAYIIGLLVTLFAKPIPAKNSIIAIGWLSLAFSGLWRIFPSITWLVIIVLNLIAVTIFWRNRITTGNWSRQNFWLLTVLFVLLYIVFRENW